MSIVLVPGQFRGDPHPVGKLASTLLSVAVAGMADPARFRRGKTYVANGSVTKLQVSPGELIATVMGSRDTPYQVVAALKPIPRPELAGADALRSQINRLTPEAGEMMVSCTCPDWDDPCKHAIAGLLAFAAELVSRPELLLEWRCEPADGDGPSRARVGSRARASERHLRLAPSPTERVRAPEPPSPWENEEWLHFLGTPPPVAPHVPRQAAVVRRAMLGTIDLGAWVKSALDELTGLQ